MDDSMFDKFKDHLESESYKNKFQSKITLNSENKKIETFVEKDFSKIQHDFQVRLKKQFEEIEKSSRLRMDSLNFIPHNGKKFHYDKKLIIKSSISVIDILAPDEGINFLYIYLSQFKFSSSNEELAHNLSKSSLLKETINKLFQETITIEMLQNILTENKPFLSFGRIVDYFRRNVVFIDLYCQIINKDYVESEYLTSTLGSDIKKHFLKALVNHPSFANLPCSIFLNKEFNFHLTIEKLQVIKHFNKIVLQLLEEEYSNDNLNFKWIQKIDIKYFLLFGERYRNINEYNHVSFKLFSKNEFEMVAFIIGHAIKDDDGFPVLIQEQLWTLLAAYDFKLEYIDSINAEFEKVLK